MAGAQEPSTFQKLKMGMLTGGLVGLTIGFIFGNFAIISCVSFLLLPCIFLRFFNLLLPCEAHLLVEENPSGRVD